MKYFKRLFALILSLGVVVVSVAPSVSAATQTNEVELTYENLPLEIHAGDKLIMDAGAEGGGAGSILYREELINSNYETSKWGFSSTDDYFRVYYNDTNFAFSTSTSQTLAANFSDDWISWTVNGNIGTLEFLQDWPYAVDSMYSVNGTNYTAKTSYSYGDNISLYAHLELTTEIPDYTLASELGLQITVNGSAIDVDDYFKFVERNGYYQLVSNVSDTVNYEKIYDDNYYVNLFNLLNNGVHTIRISFGDGVTLQDFKVLEIASSTSGVNPSVVSFDGSSIAPELVINDLGDNLRQYNFYDDQVLDATYSSGYNQVSKYIALLIEKPSETSEIAVVNFFVEGALLSSKEFVIEGPGSGTGGGGGVPAVDQPLVDAPTEPTLSGYTFIGWFDANDVLWDFSANPLTQTEVNLYAKFVSDSTTVHSVFFEEGLGSALDDRLVVDGEALVQPSNPFLLGHELTNWYTDEDLTEVYDFDTAVSADLTLYAGYEIGEYEISFDTNGGTDVDPIVALYQTSISRPENPTRTGYSFGGWYIDEDLTERFNFETMPGYDIQLQAKWVANNSSVIDIPAVSELTTSDYIVIGIVAATIIAAVVTIYKKRN